MTYLSDDITQTTCKIIQYGTGKQSVGVGWYMHNLYGLGHIFH